MCSCWKTKKYRDWALSFYDAGCTISNGDYETSGAKGRKNNGIKFTITGKFTGNASYGNRRLCGGKAWTDQ